MVYFIVFSLAFLLALRSLILFIYEKRKAIFRYSHLLLLLPLILTTWVFFFLPAWNVSFPIKAIGFALLAALVTIPLIDRLRKKQIRSFSPLKLLALTLFFSFSAALYFHATLFGLTDDRAILKIAMTGNTHQKWVEWKNPQGELKKEFLNCYEIEVSSQDGSVLEHFHLYGDLCAIRAKVLRFHPWLNSIGIDNLYHVEAVYNGYKNPLDYQQFPIEAHAFSFSGKNIIPWKNIFWQFWTRTFSEHYTSKWIKSASLTSSYFPLTDAEKLPYSGSFFLTISSAGLSSIAASN